MAEKIFCTGALLDAVQRRNIYPDCKTFVDLHLKDDPDVVLEAFQKLQTEGSLSDEKLHEFLSKWFSGPGGELEDWIPSDWTQSPQLLNKINNQYVRTFAKQLNDLWRILGKKLCADMSKHPERHTLLQVPNPFIIPGDRFKEFYYWDSFWIVGGLLSCGMTDTVQGMIENFIHIVDTYGMVPNGGRIYFLNRSQPPLLLPMVDLYFQRTRNLDFVRRHIGTLERETRFWEARMCDVLVQGKKLRLARYFVQAAGPRPEGYTMDIKLSTGLPDKEAAELHSEIQSACESGWDFSSRWFSDMRNLSTIKTRDVFPVDLNSFICMNYKIMASLLTELGDSEGRARYDEKARQLQRDIHDGMWDPQEGCWFDLHLDPNDKESGAALPRKSFYLSNFTPLFADCCSVDLTDEKNVLNLVRYIQSHGIAEYPGGAPTSLSRSGEQWDYPNAWPPLVHILVEGLSRILHIKAQELAKSLAQTWIQANVQAFYQTGHMFEKYNCERPGRAGGGGEYSVQVGFGWTNGVCLMLIDKYSDTLGYDVTLTPTKLSHQLCDRIHE